MRTLHLAAVLAALLGLLGGTLHADISARADLDLAGLADCVADSGAVYYGAHWCPYCRKQNAFFGEHADRLPYVECYDGPKSGGKNAACDSAGVRGFPTWQFAGGERRSGALSPAELAAATGCY